MEKVHHANILLRQENQMEAILSFLDKKLSFDTKRNPDFLLLENDVFGIEDSRNFEKWAIGKPLISETKVALLVVNSITFEAQNALLKVLEEPTPGTYVFISVVSLGNILPTLLSRVQILNISTEGFVGAPKTKSKDASENFLLANFKEKFATIRSLAKNDKKTEMKSLIQDLERFAFKNSLSYDAKKNILIAKTFVSARGASSKMLLEWLACVL